MYSVVIIPLKRKHKRLSDLLWDSVPSGNVGIYEAAASILTHRLTKQVDNERRTGGGCVTRKKLCEQQAKTMCDSFLLLRSHFPVRQIMSLRPDSEGLP